MAKKDKEFNLEQAFEEIEGIIAQLETDNVSLKDSIELYGKGAKLLTSCKEELTGIEKELIVIKQDLDEEEESYGI